MNILFICDEYPPGLIGGIGAVTQSLCKTYVAQGHHVYVVGFYKENPLLKEYEENDGVKIRRFFYPKAVGDIQIIKKLKRYFSIVSSASRAAYQAYMDFVLQLIKEAKIDIVEMADWNTYVYDTGITQPFPKLPVPLIMKFHGSRTYFDSEMQLKLRRKWFLTDNRMIERADALMSVSHHTAEVNRRLFRIDKEIKVLHNGVELPLVATEKKAAKVIFTGSLVKKKGIFSLIKAWNSVSVRHPEAVLFVFGKGETQALLELLSDSSKQNVFFMGHQPKDVLMQHLQESAIAVFPSYSETFGLAPVEAMSASCATIFTQRSCGPEIITDHKTGILVDPDDIVQIAEAINKLLEDAGLRQPLGENGRKDVEERFDINKIAKQHIVFYNQIIQSYKG